ncbi:hypothetical protein ABL78_5191 [Leptomonas seymouri]|uniref:Uncharacterized protein n=1 Tax=Leptomonas seymouri TaxID=5684 RepID=A0A0N1IK16_LEPSE|nr:hypothetical protein ABL78_5191 [Leptomonas seymouri]|eukprot:KPI85742.1 hypothetical protein ABL78_5191 [Leptomonas seymouri]
MPPSPSDEQAPELIEFYSDPDDDSYGLRSFLEAITNPQLLVRVQYSLRTIALVTFPLFTLSLHPNTRYRLGFPPLLIASVVSTSTHRPTIGEQIGLHSWTWRGILYMLVWGSVTDAWGVAYHVGAWYGLLATGIFGAGLVNNGNMRRFMFLYFFLYMLELRTHAHYFDTVPLNDAAYSAADYLIGSLMGVAANTIPFPCLVSETVDKCLTKIFGGFGKLLFNMIHYTWSPDVHAAAFFFDNRIPFITMEAVLSQMSSLLWYASWEPMEFPLRNPTRRVKLSLMRRIMALGYAAFSCGRVLAALRQQQADRMAMHKAGCSLYGATHRNVARAIKDVPIPLTPPSSGNSRSDSDDEPSVEAVGGEAKESIEALRANTYTYVKDFATVLMQATALIGSTESTPEQLIKKVPFDALHKAQTLMRRNMRLELLQVMKIQSEMVAQQRAREQKRRHASAPEEKGDADGTSRERSSEGMGSPPREPEDLCEFRETNARLMLEHGAAIDACDVFLRINHIFFHLLMDMIAGEILNFGEQMKEYKPTESLFCRWWTFYIVEAWDGFWSELWCRITLARPTDYRNIKDAIRMTCAYVSSVVLSIELWNPLNGLYFFGVTPLMGLPLEEESLGMGICRIAGNTMGCALGYMAYHNSNNFAQQIAMTLCFAFVQRCCQYHPQYGQFFFYGAVITLAGVATAMVFNELVVRLVTSSYTVMAYLMCCMFIFPNDCCRICFNYRCKLTKVMSETIDDVALTAHLPIECRSTEGADGSSRNTEPMQMCSQLSVELMLIERLQMMCDKWAPFAARDLVIRGEAQFPAGPHAVITRSHDRLVAHLRLLVFGVQLLHRRRSAPPSPPIAYLIHSSLVKFLNDFADAVRLVGMDHVQAMQRPRTWSYPRHLSRVSQLRRLRVRLHALMYECYVVVTHKISKGAFTMAPKDAALMHRDNSGQRIPAAAAGGGDRRPSQPGDGGGSGGGAPRNVPQSHEDCPYLSGAGDSRVHYMTPLPPNDKAMHNTGCAAPAAPIEVSTGEGGSNGVSFVDRHLASGKGAELAQGPQTVRRVSSRCAPLRSIPLSEEPLILDAGHQQRSSLHTSHESAVDMAFSTATRTPWRRRSSTYAHRAYLQQGAAEPADAWPLTVVSAERDVEKMLSDEKQQLATEEPNGSRGHAVLQSESPRDGETGSPSSHSQHSPAAASKTQRGLPQLNLLPGRSHVAYTFYKGPSFTFVEGDLDTPVDTDFSAITTILLSCESIMTELESQCGSLNCLTNYNKQLQETSLATAFLDKWSARLVEYRKRIYNCYHYPKPPPQKRGPIHTQDDPFEDWEF